MSVIGMTILGGESDKPDGGEVARDLLNELRLNVDEHIVGIHGGGDAHLVPEGSTTLRLKHKWAQNEAAARQELWEYVLKAATPGDWVVCLDADEFIPPRGWNTINRVMDGCRASDMLCARMYDMWSETMYRSDSLWTAHTRAWPIAVRISEKQYTRSQGRNPHGFINKHLHCGRFPAHYLAQQGALCGAPVLHFSYHTPELRAYKYNRYMALDGAGKYGSLRQYKSIVDSNPNLLPIAEVLNR